jgi:peptidoglycan-N-acetylglucosamine deacetylase
VRMSVMRPPYGGTDERVAAATRRMGLAQILWHVDTLDWRDRVAKKVARRAGRARPGSIVLMHDTRRTTVDAVPEMLDTLAGKGYTFVTVSELYGKTPPPGKVVPSPETEQ